MMEDGFEQLEARYRSFPLDCRVQPDGYLKFEGRYRAFYRAAVCVFPGGRQRLLRGRHRTGHQALEYGLAVCWRWVRVFGGGNG
jgi:hypothetical protein